MESIKPTDLNDQTNSAHPRSEVDWQTEEMIGHESDRKEMALLWKKLEEKVLEMADKDTKELKEYSVDELRDVVEQSRERVQKREEAEYMKRREEEKNDKRHESKSSSWGEETRLVDTEGNKEEKTRNRRKRAEAIKKARDKLPGISKKVAKGLLKVGSVAASTASLAVPPVQVTCNVLTLVMTTWEKFDEMFDELASLLSKCVEFLDRYRIHQDNQLAILMPTCSKFLQLFIDICDYTIVLRSSKKKMVAVGDNLITGEEYKVKKFSQCMDDLLEAEAQNVRLATLRIVLEGQREQQIRERHKVIVKALQFPDSSINPDWEPNMTWEQDFRRRQKVLIKGMGEWLATKEKFLQWSAKSTEAPPILTLEGGTGSGRTLLMTTLLSGVRKHNQNRPVDGAPTVGRASPTGPPAQAFHRVVTAYFFGQSNRRKAVLTRNDEDSSRKTEETDFLDTATRALLWQLSIEYEPMTTAVAVAALIHNDDLRGARRLWELLFFDIIKKKHQETTFLIFIDAPDTDVIQLRKLMNLFTEKRDADGITNARLFVTTLPDVAQTWYDSSLAVGGTKISFQAMKVSEHNQCDVATYIDDRLELLMPRKTIAYENNDFVNSLVNRIRQHLNGKIGGDYYLLHQALVQISRFRYYQEIDTILEGLNATKKQQVQTMIKNLNERLTGENIDQLNEIILWVAKAKGDGLTVQDMEVILAIDHCDNSERDSGQTWFRPFIRQQLEQYSDLLTITHDDDRVEWRSVEIAEAIPSASNLESDLGPILPAEVNIVQHFFRTICPEDLYNRFRLESFFQLHRQQTTTSHSSMPVEYLITETKSQIHIDTEYGDLKMALKCLRILTDKTLHQYASLRKYAARHVLGHLNAIRGSSFARVNPSAKAQMCQLLVKLLTDAAALDALFWPTELHINNSIWTRNEGMDLQQARLLWIYSDEGVKEAARWLKDETLAGDLLDEHGRNLVASIKQPNVNLHRALLQAGAKHMAHRLFCRPKFHGREFDTAIAFLRSYLIQIENQFTSSMSPISPNELLQRVEKDKLNQEEFKAIKDWSQDVLAEEQGNDAIWQANIFQILMMSLAEGVYFDKFFLTYTMLHVKMTFRFYRQDAFACYMHSHIEPASNDEAILIKKNLKDAMEGIMSLLEQESTTSNDDLQFNRVLLGRIMSQLGLRKWASGETSEGAQLERDSLKYGYTQMKYYASVLNRYWESNAWDEIIRYISAMVDQAETWIPHIEDFYADFAESKKFSVLDILVKAANAPDPGSQILKPEYTKGRWEIIEKLFSVAICGTERKEFHHLRIAILEYGARTLARACGNIMSEEVRKRREEAWRYFEAHSGSILSSTFLDSIADYLAEMNLNHSRTSEFSEKEQDVFEDKLKRLIRDPKKAWKNSVAACCLIHFSKHRYGKASGVAAECVQVIVRDGIDLLSDSDESNDDSAYQKLAELFTTLEDRNNAEICWSLRRNHWYNKTQVTIGTASTVATDQELVTSEPISVYSADIDDAEPREGLPQVTDSEDYGPNDETTDFDKSVENGLVENESEVKCNDNISFAHVKDPTAFVTCSGCDLDLSFASSQIFSCADCGGRRHYDETCLRLLECGEMNPMEKGLACHKNHKFISVPKWDVNPLNSWKLDDISFISFEEWKKKLEVVYL